MKDKIKCKQCNKVIDVEDAIVFQKIGFEKFNYKFCSWQCVKKYVDDILKNIEDIPIIRTDALRNIQLEGFKQPIVIRMGKITKVIRGNTEIVYIGKKEHTKRPYILINGKKFEVV